MLGAALAAATALWLTVTISSDGHPMGQCQDGQGWGGCPTGCSQEASEPSPFLSPLSSTRSKPLPKSPRTLAVPVRIWQEDFWLPGTDPQGQLKYRRCCQAAGEGFPEAGKEIRLVRPVGWRNVAATASTSQGTLGSAPSPSSGRSQDPTSALFPE